MSDNKEIAEQNSPMVEYSSGTTDLILNPESMASVMNFAKMMAKGTVSVPEHFRGKESDCLAITLQAMQWKMNPFVVVQKTHIVNGTLGYEAQLVSAVASASGIFKTAPNYEFFGEWARVRGKFKNVKKIKNGKEYWVTEKDWDKSDEEGLGVRCTATLKGESEPRVVELFLSQCHPRFSTLWVTDPEQQITYTVVKKFCRRHSPGAILGVYTDDELGDYIPAGEEIKASPRQVNTPEKPEYPKDKFKHNFPLWEKAIKEGQGTQQAAINKIEQTYTLTQEMKEKILAIEIGEVVDAEEVPETNKETPNNENS